MTSDLFEEYLQWQAKTKIELVEQKLIIGKSLSGSRLLFNQILRGWKAISAVALAPEYLWWQALNIAFGAPAIPDLNAIDAAYLRSWASEVIFTPQVTKLTERTGRKSSNIRETLYMAFFGLRWVGIGQSLGRVFVNRLGGNAFMPDILFYKGQGLNRLYDYYLEGRPPELVIEFITPEYTSYDTETKRAYYEAAGVPEYWIFDTEQENIKFLRLENGVYQRQHLSDDGRYEVSSIPGLTFLPAKLWEAADDFTYLKESDLFEIDSDAPKVERIKPIGEGIDWSRGQLGFATMLEPVPISFEDYIYWCPEPKFEFVDGKPYIGSRDGIKGLTGMFLMTFGLVESVKLLHPIEWVEALLAVRFAVQNTQEYKAQVWQLLHKTAILLREKYGASRLGVIGKLVKPEPLNFWDEITIVAWNLPSGQMGKAYLAVSEFSESFYLHLIDAEDATDIQLDEMASGLVEI
ncbi:hypothetical protein NIES4071_01500 [Calothrix sp. NIES-4071]|nr:hypothetical protein NIES4071_01500 [Calothrix sp. NIES-4071]BAZ54496.1 hypothetical protein NIES4105_01490 [Calothrix sp. NIES-4105]